jgi:hypothetical protein
MEDLVVPHGQYATDSYYNYDIDDPENWCVFGIQNGSSYYSYSSSGYWNLGSTLLRHTYTVFDLVNSEVAFAPVKFGAADEAVVPFASYGAAVPAATKVCPASGCATTTARATATRRPGSSSTGSSGSGSGSGSSNDGSLNDGDDSGPHLPSVGAVVGAAVGAAAGALLIGGIILLAIRNRRAKKARDDTAEKGTLAPSVSDAGAPEVGEPPRAHTRDGFLAPPLPGRPVGRVPSIEVTPAILPTAPEPPAAAAPTMPPPAVPEPTEAPPAAPVPAEQPGEAGKGKEPER